MSERNCVLHGALEVEWHTEDVPDIDGEPRCYVCELEARAEKAEASVKDMYEALKRDELLANVAILATPSGPKRNKLTETNLLRLQALAKARGESQ